MVGFQGVLEFLLWCFSGLPRFFVSRFLRGFLVVFLVFLTHCVFSCFFGVVLRFLGSCFGFLVVFLPFLYKRVFLYSSCPRCLLVWKATRWFCWMDQGGSALNQVWFSEGEFSIFGWVSLAVLFHVLCCLGFNIV